MANERDPETLLEKFSDKWQVNDRVATADVVGTHDERAVREEHLITEVEEDVQSDRTMPASTYRNECEQKVSFENRYDDPPRGEDGTVEYVQKGQEPRTCSTCGGRTRITCPRCEGDGQQTCPTCSGSLTQTCGDCRGSGTESCGKCSGSGTVGYGDDESTCPNCGGSGKNQCGRCGGSGNHTCQDCGGNGSVTCRKCSGNETVVCPTCEGDGRVVTATRGTIEFTFTNQNEFRSDYVPTRFLSDDAGIHVDTDVKVDDVAPTPNDADRIEDGDTGIFRHTVRMHEIPVRSVAYEFNGSKYEFHAVEDELRASSYPQSMARRVAGITTSIAVLVVMLLVGSFLGYLPPVPGITG